MPTEFERKARFATEDLEKDHFQLEKAGLVDPDERIDLGELTDLPGVGPKIARKFKRAGIRGPEELQGKSQEEISAIDGIGPKLAARIRTVVDQIPPQAYGYGSDPETSRSRSKIRRRGHSIDISEADTVIADEPDPDKVKPHPYTVGVEGDDKEDAIADHAERSPESRRADESFNAPIALDYELWASNPNRYDYPGVDTISKRRHLSRSRSWVTRALELDAIRSVEVGPRPESLDAQSKGSYRKFGGAVTVDSVVRDAEVTLAHEIGHAIDDDLDRPSDRIFDDDDVRAEARDLIETQRGVRLKDEAYQLEDNEMFANLFAAAALEPRATRRDSPKAYRAIEDELLGRWGRF